MEKGMPTIEQGEKKAEQKNPFEILTAELAGKTRDELTPEQRETEEAFQEKAFRDLMQLINDDEVLIHSTRNAESVLEQGLLSPTRMQLKGLPYNGDPIWQVHEHDNARHVVKEFLKLYISFKKGEINEDEFLSKREEFIHSFPRGFPSKVNQTRARKYFEKTIPYGFDHGWFDKKDDLNYNAVVEGYDTNKPLATNFTEARNLLRYREQANVTGRNFISSDTSHNIKKNFVNNGNFSHAYQGGMTVFFDKPTAVRMMSLGGVGQEEEDSNDMGVASKVSPKNFRAVQEEKVLYDWRNRTMYCFNGWHGGNITHELLEKMKDLQKNKLSVADNTLQVIPPIESIKIVTVPYNNWGVFSYIDKLDDPTWGVGLEEEKYDNKRNAEIRQELEKIILECDEDTNPKRLRDLMEQNQQQTNKKIRVLIEENHWDWYEKYGKKSDE